MGFTQEFRCLNDHTRDVFEHTRSDVCATEHSGLVVCEKCGHSMGPVMAYGHPMLFFEEGRTRMISNLDDQPIPISSYREYERKKRERGVENAGALKNGKGRWL
jgi:hypothetical protein